MNISLRYLMHVLKRVHILKLYLFVFLKVFVMSKVFVKSINLLCNHVITKYKSLCSVHKCTYKLNAMEDIEREGERWKER